jgi:hypothetical protein
MGCSSQSQGRPQHRPPRRTGIPSQLSTPLCIARMTGTGSGMGKERSKGHQRAGCLNASLCFERFWFKPWWSWQATQITSRASDHPTHQARGFQKCNQPSPLHAQHSPSEERDQLPRCPNAKKDCTHLQFLNRQTSFWPSGKARDHAAARRSLPLWLPGWMLLLLVALPSWAAVCCTLLELELAGCLFATLCRCRPFGGISLADLVLI